MNYFKRFSDFCAGFSAFCAAVYVFGQFMTYNPADAEGIIEKLKLFLSKENAKDYREYVILIILLIGSVIVGCIFEKLPYIGTAISLLPMLQTILMFSEGKLYDRPMLYIVLGLIHVSGSIVYALSLDKADGKKRAFYCTNICGICASALGFLVYRRAGELASIAEADATELGTRDYAIYLGTEEDIQGLILKISIMILCGIALSVILRDIYFIDAFTAAVPLCYTVYLIFSEKLNLFSQAILAIVSFYFFCRVLIMIFEPVSENKRFTVRCFQKLFNKS